ncbi:LPS export ABC transporter periplasmic protein LptC [Pseudoxanthomonas kalamensis DSM 18571]|uniref:LPS export ABC transporter periplasmic protein LptC n=1 Tax=Pseudoxanthomonas kalamensis TaxID=289483 RepID=UPI0013910700|nr:LPS export ABC transporter periplasmic protein LptC [Pseudoxanthomonas kalamensis]KAF1711427.1 LPS export ABC transporter periplasmic protein LptC [Pseudoxanthomonas kalamensis DSM 18571]
MNWRLLLGLGLLLAAILGGWSAWKHRDQPQPQVMQTGRPDYVMRDFEMIVLDDAGSESLSLRAPLMERDPNDHTYTIATPLFLIPDDEGRNWELRADSGWASAKGDEVKLKDDVIGTSPPGSSLTGTFETAYLDVLPRENLARTDAAVTLTQPGSILKGVGFEIHTKTKRYAFKSKVRSRYEPHAAR